MIIELFKTIPDSETFIFGFIIIIAATTNFKAAAAYALAKEKNEITINNVYFTRFIGITAPSTFIILGALWGLL
ncbi:hypothetical protein [Anaerophaga thermohalophila]|uniref:hypothetical protein n=1 Tax=Anaerophaga thermohalophila TaxID=177400 RepID=UPI000237BB16|nr:hypothetical protein [Anaerophaga thermohalophila]